MADPENMEERRRKAIEDLYAAEKQEEIERREFRRKSYEMMNESSPDDAAEALALGDKFGVPRQAIELDPEMWREKDRAAQRRLMESASPRVMAWMDNADNHAVAKDEIDLWGSIEKYWTGYVADFGGSAKRDARNISRFAQAGWESMSATKTYADREQLVKAARYYDEYDAWAAREAERKAQGRGGFMNRVGMVPVDVGSVRLYLPGDSDPMPEPTTRLLQEAASRNQTWWQKALAIPGDDYRGNTRDIALAVKPMIEEKLAAATTEAKAKRAKVNELSASTGDFMADSLLGGVRAITEMTPLIVSAFANKGRTIPAIVMGAQVYYGEFNEGLEQGLDIDRATERAVLQAGVETISERISLGIIDDMLKSDKGLMTRFAGAMVAEQAQEQAATLGNRLVDWAYLTPDMTVGQFIDETPRYMIQTALTTLVASAGMQTTFLTVDYGVQQMTKDRLFMEPSKGDKLIDKTVEKLAKSKLVNRSPEKATELAGKLVGDADTVVVDLDGLGQALSDAGLDVGEVMTTLGIDQAAIGAEGQIMGQIEVSTAAILTAAVRGGVADKVTPHMFVKGDASGMTPAGKEALRERFNEHVRGDLAKVAEAAARDASLAEQIRDVEDKIAELTRQQGYNAKPGELRAGARIHALLLAHAAKRRAAERGEPVDVRAMFEEYGARFAGQENAPETDDAALRQPREAWQAEKETDPEIAGMLLYHGTGHEFTGFTKNAEGRATGISSGTGAVFLTTSPDVAEVFAENAALNSPGATGPRTMQVVVRGRMKQITERLSYAEEDAAIRAAKAEGYDGVVFRNPAQPEEQGGMTFAVFDPSNIRSVHAAFDPDASQSADLLAQSIRTAATMPMEQVTEWVAANISANIQTMPNGDESSVITFPLAEDEGAPDVMIAIRLNAKGRADVNLFLDNKMADALDNVEDVNERSRLAMLMFAKAVMVMRQYAAETDVRAFAFTAAESQAEGTKAKSREALYRYMLSTLTMEGYTAYEIASQTSVVQEQDGVKSANPMFPSSGFVLVKDGVDPNEFARNEILRGRQRGGSAGEVVTALTAKRLGRGPRATTGGMDGRGQRAGGPDTSGDLNQLIGPKAKSANKEILNHAMKMAKEKVKVGKGLIKRSKPKYTRQQIWDETAKMGQPWYQDADGNWISEIEDGTIVVNEAKGKLEEVIEFPSIVREYPQIGKLKTDARDVKDVAKDARQLEPGGVGGWFNPKHGIFGVAIRIISKDGRREYTATHEIQHAVDVEEGRKLGGKKTPYEQKPTERRAFNTMYRRLWSMEERIARPPWTTEQEAMDWWRGGRALDAPAAEALKDGTFDPVPTATADPDVAPAPSEIVPNADIPGEGMVPGEVYTTQKFDEKRQRDVTFLHRTPSTEIDKLLGRTFLGVKQVAAALPKNSRLRQIIFGEDRVRLEPGEEQAYGEQIAAEAAELADLAVRLRGEINDAVGWKALLGVHGAVDGGQIYGLLEDISTPVLTARLGRDGIANLIFRAARTGVSDWENAKVVPTAELRATVISRLEFLTATEASIEAFRNLGKTEPSKGRAKADRIDSRAVKAVEEALAGKMLDLDAPMKDQLPEHYAAIRKLWESEDFRLGAKRNEDGTIEHDYVDYWDSDFWSRTSAYEEDGTPFGKRVVVEAPPLDERSAREVLELLAERSQNEDGGEWMAGVIERLRSAGIVGGKYIPGGRRAEGVEGPPQTQSIVIFDERAPLLLTDQSGNLMQEKRGSYSPSTRQMNFGEARDPSTFMHESAHWFLDMLEKLSATETWAAEDLRQIEGWYQSIRNSDQMKEIRARYSVVETAGGFQVMYQGQAMGRPMATAEEAAASIEWRERQEAFAETFEQYLMTGKAPVPSLVKVFRAFKDWLVSLYRGLMPGERANLNPEIRDFFDRVLAVDAEVDAASAETFRDAETMAKDMLEKGIITERQYRMVGERLNEAREKVKEEMTARVMDEKMREQTDWWEKEKARVKGELARAFDKSPVGRAFNWLAYGEWKGDLPEGVKADDESVLFQFAGVKATGANTRTKQIAEKMRINGVDNETIWRETGWRLDIDGFWKWEIDDSGAKIGIPLEKVKPGAKGPLSMIYDHPMLYRMYPELANITVEITDQLPPGTKAAYSRELRHMLLNFNALQEGDAAVLSWLSHETQHAIQGLEGFSRGANLQEVTPFWGAAEVERLQTLATQLRARADDEQQAGLMGRVQEMRDMATKLDQDAEKWARRAAYMRVSGEAEARMVQERLGMTAAERQATYPKPDVPVEEMTVRFGSGKPTEPKSGYEWAIEAAPYLEDQFSNADRMDMVRGAASKEIDTAPQGPTREAMLSDLETLTRMAEAMLPDVQSQELADATLRLRQTIEQEDGTSNDEFRGRYVYGLQNLAGALQNVPGGEVLIGTIEENLTNGTGASVQAMLDYRGISMMAPENVGEPPLMLVKPEMYQGGELFQSAPAPMFYSQLERTVSNSKTAKAPAAQWKGIIQNAPGVKAEEVEWTGVMEWLDAQDGPVTREDLAAFLAGNGVQVEEVVKGGQSSVSAARQKFELEWAERSPDMQAWLEEKVWERFSEEEAERITDQNIDLFTAFSDEEIGALKEEAWDDFRGDLLEQIDETGQDITNGPKWSSYTLPGGENYREMLLTLPEVKRPITFEEYWEQTHVNDLASASPGAIAIAREAYEKTGQNLINPANYRSSHWSEPNVLAHVRFKERTGPNGERVLALEEIQSDWGQQLRREKEARAKSIDEDFDVIIERMKKSGVLKEVCP